MTNRHAIGNTTAPPSLAGQIASLWAMLGFFVLLGYAIFRLSQITMTAWALPWTTLQWLACLANLFFMAYSEGYKGFQCSYSPRFSARANYLLRQGSPVQRLLAPLFCMGFFSAPKRRIVVAFLLLLMIITLIYFFHLLPQPWRGILDAGVVIGLSWGMVATAACYWAMLKQPNNTIDAEVC